MTVSTSPPVLPPYTPCPATNEDLEFADLTILDLSKAETPEGRAELAKQACQGLHEHGFLYAINHGLSAEETKRVFDIADFTFSGVTEEDKAKYQGDIVGSGSYLGYKKRQIWHIDGGVLDQIEQLSVNCDVPEMDYPPPLRPLIPEISAFVQHNHIGILRTILRLLAIGLELPEDYFVKTHGSHTSGSYSHVRFMKYHPRSDEEEANSNNVWLKGHTDIGSITLLWSQPISALQILCRDGKWRWIKHIENALVINTGDCMEFLSGGFYQPTIHRVVQPPPDQRGFPRVGVFYFAVPDDDLRLLPAVESPVLQRYGIQRRFPDSEAPTGVGWRKARTAAYGLSTLKKGVEDGVEEEVIEGVVVKHWN